MNFGNEYLHVLAEFIHLIHIWEGGELTILIEIERSRVVSCAVECIPREEACPGPESCHP